MRTSPLITTDLTVTEAAVVGLVLDRPGSGYDILKRAHAGAGHIWEPAKSRVYSVLARLESAGLVVSRDVEQTDRPDKQVHTITAAGRRAFAAWLNTPEWRSHEELLLKVFFGRHAEHARLVELVTRYRDSERARLDEYREIEQRIASDPESRYGYATLRYGLAAARARIRWADEVLRELGEGA